MWNSWDQEIPELWAFCPLWLYFCCCYSVAKSCLTLCNSTDCSMPASSVLRYLPEFAQIHVHWVSLGKKKLKSGMLALMILLYDHFKYYKDIFTSLVFTVPLDLLRVSVLEAWNCFSHEFCHFWVLTFAISKCTTYVYVGPSSTRRKSVCNSKFCSLSFMKISFILLR